MWDDAGRVDELLGIREAETHGRGGDAELPTKPQRFSIHHSVLPVSSAAIVELQAVHRC
jgi:hypothetical protein